MNRLFQHESDEQGSALVMALVFVTVVSLLIGVTLAFAEASVRYGDQISESRNNLYTADGAIEMAISNVALDGRCESAQSPLPPFLLNGNDVESGDSVRCYQAATVPFESSSATRPSQAALAMSSETGEGVVQTGTSGPLTIGGSVFSNSQVIANASNGVTAEGPINAVGTCNGDVKATPIGDRNCSEDDPGNPVTPMASAPAYPMAISQVPASASIPACNLERVDLMPGYYDDASALSKFTDNDGNCDTSLVWMAPGQYYFNFDFSAASPCSDPAKCIWKVIDPDVQVVAGTSVAPPSTVTVPDACSGTDTGVQFIFGGESHMEVTDAAVELCTPNIPGQRISLYGIPDAGPVTPLAAILIPAVVDEVTLFDLTDNAIDIDSLLSPATVDDTATPTASITLKAYAPSLPPGSKVTSANLRIQHYQSASGLLDVSAKVTPGDGSSEITLPALRNNCTAICTETPTVTLSAAQLDGVEITYSIEAKPGSGSTFGSLDGIWIEVDYEPPSFEALGGCLVDPVPCPLIKADAGAVLAIQGTVYAPTAAVDVDVDDIIAPVFGRGVIARTLRLGVAGSNATTPPIVDLPAIGPGRALTAVGQSVTDGIVVTGAPLVVNGDVLSRSKVDVATESNPGLIVRGALRAGGPCVGQIRADSPPLCNDTPTINAKADPEYAPPPQPSLTPEPLPPCGPPGTLLELSPGFYNDAVALSALTTGGACAGQILWFRPEPEPEPEPDQPSTYYFNFDMGGTLGCETLPDDACVWKITDPTVKVIGGEPRGWAPGSFDEDDVIFPGACQAGLESGVNFVFGGPSRLDVQAGSVELCAATKDTGGQPVAIHGLSELADSPVSVWQRDPAGITPTDFLPAANAKATKDNLLATANPSGGQAKVTFAPGFGPLDEIPTGSRITSIKVLVAHRETGPTSPVALKTAGPGSALSGGLSGCSTLCEQRLDLTGITDPAVLDDLAFEYSVTGTGTAYLDGLELEVNYTPPGYQPVSGCSVLLTSNPNACSMIEAAGTARLSIQGIVYAPKAALEVDLSDVFTPPFGQGLIARTIALAVTARDRYAGPAVAALQESTTEGPEYVITAWVNDRPRTRARVAFPEDADPVIKSWSVLP